MVLKRTAPRSTPRRKRLGVFFFLKGGPPAIISLPHFFFLRGAFFHVKPFFFLAACSRLRPWHFAAKVGKEGGAVGCVPPWRGNDRTFLFPFQRREEATIFPPRLAPRFLSKRGFLTVGRRRSRPQARRLLRSAPSPKGETRASAGQVRPGNSTFPTWFAKSH